MTGAPHAGPNFWQTARVRLRAFTTEDAEVSFLWSLDSQRARDLEHVWPPASREQVEHWVARKARQSFENGDFDMVIENAAGTPVGAISTHRCDPRTGTFSYALDIAREHRRRGYAHDAVGLLLRFYFQECRYQKVTVSVHADNVASVALHEKLGFVLEGRLRRMVYTGGRFQDEVWFGQTAEEFAARHPPSQAGPG